MIRFNIFVNIRRMRKPSLLVIRVQADECFINFSAHFRRGIKVGEHLGKNSGFVRSFSAGVRPVSSCGECSKISRFNCGETGRGRRPIPNF